ncbi:unnamed protein product [Phyllotreta striolata]|uniref:C2H2-type domain-containing protein n=1 Tax=Phyllotreta striolata TaxID=444603 RepID=A0A9P0DT06_PHYSR|nr:unnamed protein product [Phyllotreta striolata]
MTSVTLPSSSGTLNGGYSSSVAEKIPNTNTDFEALRTIKRSLSITSSESCKKRRKQSTPIRISTNEADNVEGKPIVPSPEPIIRRSVCQHPFSNSEQLQNHALCEHPPLECKKEPEEHSSTPSSYLEPSEAPMGLSMMRSDMSWVNEMQSKEWMGSNLANLPFNPTNPMFMALPQFSHTENISLKPIRIFNPDAYCDLCNKEFCNKYFLKTHKANKHGIYTDCPTSETSQPTLATNMKLTNAVPTIEQPGGTINTNTNEAKTPVNLMSAFGNIFQNPFNSNPNPNPMSMPENEVNDNVAVSNGVSSSSGSDKIFSDDPHAEDNSSPCNIQTESTSIKNDPDGLFQDTSSKLSSDQTDLSYRLRRIGVMNPKAFCEICCKEYCNKYFLRTHKLKRHGIYIPDDKEKDAKLDNVMTNVQTSPLNLIMTEQNSSDSKITSPTSIGCDICGIKFQNASLAHLHNVSVHGRMCSDDAERTESKDSNKAPEKSNPEAISEDLQKLQTMILQLNDINTNKASANYTCTICSKDFENRFYLQAHMLAEHSMLVDGELEKPDTESSSICEICGKELANVEELSRHVVDFHSNSQTLNETIKDETNDYNSGGEKLPRTPIPGGHVPERRVSMNITPTSSYCEICNKELCNKYFMKTHMQRMHGIEIENGAQIGGVVCDICNKELCSKYFLRVHKHNTHGIIEYGSNLLPTRKSDGESSSILPSSSAPLEVADPALKPGDLADLSHRYFSHFTEVCTICSRRFRSTKWLKAHLVTDHGQAGAEKWAEIEQQLQQNRANTKSSTPSASLEGSPNIKIPNGGQEAQQKVGVQNFISSLFGIDEGNKKIYQCSYCPFTSPLLPLLFVHERSHSINMEGFPLKSPQTMVERQPLQRQMLSQHSFLFPNAIKEEDGGNCKENSEDASRQDAIDKQPGFPAKMKQIELSSEIEESLKDVAKRMQWPATYAIPQNQNLSQNEQEQEQDEASPSASASASASASLPSGPGYVMQAFLLEESTSERRVMPSVVFLPMLQKQPTPITVTFTLTPA